MSQKDIEMILRFGGKNFCSFKEGFEVDLSLRDKNSITNILAVKGANASGKTNVLKVVQFIQSFALSSFSMLKPDEEIMVDSFFRNNDPIEMFIVFVKDGIEYKYELSLTKTEVISEIFSKKDKRETRIIERYKNEITKTVSEYNELKTIKQRSNVSLLSMALQYDLDSIKPLAELFRLLKTNVYLLGRREQRLNDHDAISKFYHKDNDIFQFVIDVLKKSDTGIEGIEIIESEDKESKEINYFPIFNFMTSNEKKFLTFYEQSSGTKALYLQLADYALSISSGATLVLDEFDVNLHPDLLPMLIDFFDNPEKNTKNAQLIFTTHNTEIMDKLGKYKVVFVNKQDNESFLYRLDEIPGDIIRNDRPISPVYNAGKIGGKPKIKL